MGRLARRLAPLATLAVSFAVSGCYMDHGYHDGHCDDPYGCGDVVYDGAPMCDVGVSASTIDTGSYYALEPGLVGVSVEYFGDGAWRVAAACDTPLSGASCQYTIVVTPVDGTIDAATPEGLEAGDALIQRPTGAVRLDAVTGADLDAFTLEATPGSTLEVEASIDGYCATPYLLWYSGGQSPIATTEAVDLTPSSP